MWLIQQFSVKEFDYLGYGDFIKFLEDNSSSLPNELYESLSGDMSGKSLPEVSMLGKQLIMLLSQAASSLWGNDAEFPTTGFQGTSLGHADLFRPRMQLIACSEHQCYQIYYLLFSPSLGSLVDWLLSEANTKELLCLVTTDGKIIRIDHTVTVNDILVAALQGSSFQTAVKLLSLLSLSGGEKQVPLSLLKCRAHQAIQVILKKFTGLHGQDKGIPVASRFILEWLPYVEFWRISNIEVSNPGSSIAADVPNGSAYQPNSDGKVAFIAETDGPTKYVVNAGELSTVFLKNYINGIHIFFWSWFQMLQRYIPTSFMSSWILVRVRWFYFTNGVEYIQLVTRLDMNVVLFSHAECGVQRLSAHEVIMVHILPEISDNGVASRNKTLMSLMPVTGFIPVDSVIKDWESPELVHLVSALSSQNNNVKCRYLLEVLDEMWDKYFGLKANVSSMDQELHCPKDLFHAGLYWELLCRMFNLSTIWSNILVEQAKSRKCVSDMGFKTQVTLDDALQVLQVWRRCASTFKTSIARMSKSEIAAAFSMGPSIFVPLENVSRHDDVVHDMLLSQDDVIGFFLLHSVISSKCTLIILCSQAIMVGKHDSLQVVVVDKLFYKYTLKGRNSVSNGRSECSCLIRVCHLFTPLELFFLAAIYWKTAPDFNNSHTNGLRTRTGYVPLPIESSQKEDKPEGVASFLQDHGIPFGYSVDWNSQSVASLTVGLQESTSQEGQPRSGTGRCAYTAGVLNQSITVNIPQNPDFSPSALNERDQLFYGAPNPINAQRTGKLGEMAAFDYFTNLVGEGSVNWVNKEVETGLPYDIVLSKNGESKEYIEVKATTSATKDWFSISPREWQFAVEKGDSFSVMHVVLSDSEVETISYFRNPPKQCRQGFMQLAVLFTKDPNNVVYQKTRDKKGNRK
ncbi:hypothetical protein C5167_028393 [Papaver somniferum]|nr:hypothetical protein C5167_028393 [Papaver somniferum]